MSGTDLSDESPQIVSVSKRGQRPGYSVSFKMSIPIPGLKEKSRKELGYPGVDRWTRSAQATGSKSRYLFALFFLLLPLIVYAVTLGNYFHSYLFIGSFFGICILFSQLNTSRKLFKYGPALLKLRANSEIGGEASGIIRFLKPMRGSQSVEIKLVCYEQDAIRDHDGRSRDAEYWSVKQEIRVQPQGRESIVAFNFDVPAGLPVNEPLCFYWRLELRGMSSQKSMFRSWRMPVDTVIGDNSELGVKRAELKRNGGN